jgi:protein O-GlcNAc transferase
VQPVAGHTTAVEALVAGVPLVARTGNTFATRVATSLLHAVGWPSLAASSDAAYVDTAIALARDGSRRAELRQSLRDIVPEVLSPTRHCREVEAALTRLATAPFAR